MCASLDVRVLDRFLRYGLRNVPTKLYPSVPDSAKNARTSSQGPVTLTTSKHQEAWSYLRSNFAPQPAADDILNPYERLANPDLDFKQSTRLFYRPEPILTDLNLSHLRPNVLWIFGGRSPINLPASQEEKMARTGVDVGGSGGAKIGKVEKVIVPATAHLVMFEDVGASADILVSWLEKQLTSFMKDEEFYQTRQSGKSDKNMLVMSKQWLEGVKQKRDTERPIKGRL